MPARDTQSSHSTRISWAAKETNYIEPFKTCNKGLDLCSFRSRLSEKFDYSNSQTISSPDWWSDFQPALKIEVDTDELEDTSLELDEIMLSVIVRDRILNQFALVFQCNFQALPNHPIELLSEWSKFSHSESIDLSVVATPAETRDRGPGIASNKGDVVAHKTFKLRAENQQSLRTPTRWVSPKEFEQRGVSRDTVWLVNWIGEDLERPPAENVEILLNEELREAFQILEDEGEISNLFRQEMLAAIISEFAIRAIGNDESPVEETGFRQVMLNFLSIAANLSVEEILMRREAPNFLGSVHAWAQHYVGLNQSFTQL